MSTQRSGFSDPEIANLSATTSPPEAPTVFIVDAVGLQITGTPDEFAKLTFKWKRPTRTVLTVTDALTDDVYDAGTLKGNVDGIHGINSTVIATKTDLSALLTADDRIYLGAQTTRYIVESVSASAVTIKWGLLVGVVDNATIKLTVKTGESPTVSRMVRLNCAVGDLATIYHDDLTYKSKWTNTTVLGQWEDLNKVTATAYEAGRTWTYKRLASVTPSTPLVVNGAHVIGQQTIQVLGDPTTTPYLTAGTQITFSADGEDSFVTYTVASTASSSILLTTPLTADIATGLLVWKFMQYTETATPVPYTFPDYSTPLITEFTGYITLSDLGGYYLYSKELPASQGSKGALRATVTTADANLSHDATTGMDTYVYNAPTTYFDGRTLYFSVSAYDQEMSTANESLAALNAYATTWPGQAHITIFTQDIANMQGVVTYERIASGTLNPHLFEVMNQATAQYSPRGGYDLFSKAMTPMAAADGWYEGIDATHGKYVNSAIVIGDMVRVVDSVSRHIWMATATATGEVSLDDALLTYGALLVSYLTGHASANVSSDRCAIDSTNDSVLPWDVSIPATPVKQYLTDLNNTFTVSFSTVLKYAVAIDSVDTEITKGNLP